VLQSMQFDDFKVKYFLTFGVAVTLMPVHNKYITMTCMYILVFTTWRVESNWKVFITYNMLLTVYQLVWMSPNSETKRYVVTFRNGWTYLLINSNVHSVTRITRMQTVSRNTFSWSTCISTRTVVTSVARASDAGLISRLI